MNNLFYNRFIPRVPKRQLLFIAAFMWTLAGAMLFFRGFSMLMLTTHFIALKLLLSIIGGILFYVLLFSKISLKHTHRILKMTTERPYFFAFFNSKSYLMMVFMISMGIFLRTSGLVPLKYLSVLYLTMALPLSSYRRVRGKTFNQRLIARPQGGPAHRTLRGPFLA